MRVHDEEEDESPEVNMAPLIDCVFLLLIFFLLTSSIQKLDDDKKEKTIQQLLVTLPEAAAAVAAPAQPATLVIGVDASGRFYLENHRVGIETLHERLREAAKSRSRIRIEGDAHAEFQHIAHVVDLCQFEGLHEISVRTRDK